LQWQRQQYWPFDAQQQHKVAAEDRYFAGKWGGAGGERVARPVVGTASTSKIKCTKVIRQLHFHVSQLDPNVSTDDMKDYCRDEAGFTPIDCRKVSRSDSDAKSASFRLIVRQEESEKVMNAATWPEGVLCRPWIWNAYSIASNENNAGS
jgi:hypothetical protein